VFLACLLADTLLDLWAYLACPLALPLAPLLVLRYNAADHSTVAQSSFCLALLYQLVEILLLLEFFGWFIHICTLFMWVAVRVPGL
jgi:uncharacterized membrane protein